MYGKGAGSKVTQALQGQRPKFKSKMNKARDKLMVEDFFELKPLKLPTDAWKDYKKLTKFLSEVQVQLNLIVKACQI